jgi:radical SAM superfamily enzyme YgiQ (UPF0313 family)
MKVLFTHSYFLRLDPKQWRVSQPYPPLGTLYAAAYLRQHGFDVALCDVMFADGAGHLLPYLEQETPDLLVIYDDGFNYLTKMCLTNMRHAAFEMAKMATNRGVKVVVCSSDSTDHFEKYLENGVDYVIPGEGEEGLLALCKGIEAGQSDFSEVAGLIFKEADRTIQTVKRPVMRDLDHLPMPAWDLVDIEPYRRSWEKHGYFSINMVTTRGCPYKCNWCAKPIYGNRYNSHSPQGKAEELEYLVERFGATHVWFCDDIFGLKPGWVPEFADALQERGIRIKFKIQSRADLLLKDQTVADLARAGCNEVWMGAESGSQRILDAMDKGVTVEEIRKARQMLGKHGIRAAFFLQFGYLGETWEDIQATLELLLQTLPEDIGVSVSYPLPGTGFYENVKSQLGSKQNWSDSDDLALMFRNTYSPEFYRRLHRYIHKRYRLEQSIRNRSWKTMYYIPATWVEKRLLSSILKKENPA